jgi:arylsulfatase A-like enzyme
MITPHGIESQLSSGRSWLSVLDALKTGDMKAGGGTSLRTEHWRYTRWDHGREGHKLYDHRTDPHEHRNLADDPQIADVIKRLAARITQSARKE